jgi:hypothetical protein
MAAKQVAWQIVLQYQSHTVNDGGSGMSLH